MYVNYFDREVKTAGENATPKEARIHVPEYRLYLPGKAELRRKLEEWAGEAGRERRVLGVARRCKKRRQ
jgi:hypothetical protein